jgi:hypothetical protein
MPDKDGKASIGPKQRAILVELIDVAAKAMGLTERAKIDKESGAVLFDAFEVWDDDTATEQGWTDPRQRAYVISVAETVYSFNRDEPPDCDVREVARVNGENNTAAEVVQRFLSERIWSALEEHGVAIAWKESEAAAQGFDEEG